MQIDRRTILATLGATAAIESMPSEALADALEHYLSDQLDQNASPQQAAAAEGTVLQGDGPRKQLEPMPSHPTLFDFFRLRFAPANHVLQSATRALKTGMSEETILACLLHDIVLSLIKPDHGWWGTQLIEPYVPEKVSWAIRYHQALRFYPDPSVGYEYPEMYYRIFGRNYTPAPHIESAY